MKPVQGGSSRRVVLDYTDGALFGNDAGEDEDPDILNSYFVDQPAFAPFFSRKNPFRVAKSRKGMGKSALLAKLAYELEQDADHPLVVKVTGANLVGVASPPQTGHVPRTPELLAACDLRPRQLRAWIEPGFRVLR